MPKLREKNKDVNIAMMEYLKYRRKQISAGKMYISYEEWKNKRKAGKV